MIEGPHQLGFVTLLFAVSASRSSASVTCGDKTCSAFEYCSEDSFCNSCKDICDKSSHNFDYATCGNKCSDAVKELYIYLVISLVLSLAALLLVLIVVLTVWLKYQKMKSYTKSNEKTIKKKMETIKAICVNEMENTKRMKLDIPVPVPDKDTPPSALTTMTPLSRRHPSEDATLEFAYDNPTLTHSPVLGKSDLVDTPDTTPKNNRTETSF